MSAPLPPGPPERPAQPRPPRELRLHVEPGTLEPLRPDESWRAPANLLAAAQVLAVALAAGWAIFLFFRFEVRDRELNQQLLETQALQSRLALEISGLEAERTEIEIAGMQSTRLEMRQEITIDDLGALPSDATQHTFLVSYEYAVTNLGDTAAEVTYALLEAHGADLPRPRAGDAEEINGFYDDGPVAWRCLLRKSHYESGGWQEDSAHRTRDGERVPFRKGGGGTGAIDPGETSRGGFEMVLVDRPHDLVGFAARIGLNGGAEPRDRWQLNRVIHLEATAPDGAESPRPDTSAGGP